MTHELVKSFRAACRVTPLVDIRTPENAATMRTISNSLKGGKQEIPLLLLDLLHASRPAGRQEQGTPRNRPAAADC
jgi:hypothetical protein